MAANQLAVEAVNHESDTPDQEIRNLKTELELRRELANNSPMAIIQRHGTRAEARAASTKATRCPTASIGCSGVTWRHAMNGGRGCCRAGFSAGARQRRCGGGHHRRGRGRQLSSASTRRQRCRAGAVAGCQRGLLPGVAAVPCTATVYGWVWMRRRLLACEEDAQARRRLVRSEIAGVVAIGRWKPAC